jgi:hypothetical protein
MTPTPGLMTGLEALHAAVGALRTEHTGCNALDGRSSCPWPVMWTEDIDELHRKLIEIGYEIVPS